MSLPDLRVALETAAKHGGPEVAAFARDMLATWGQVSKDTARKRAGKGSDVPRNVPGQVATIPDPRAGKGPDVPGTSRAISAVGGRGALSGSHVSSGSPSLSGSLEPQRESACASAPTPARESSKAQTEEQPRKETQVTLTLPISDELTAIAGMCEVKDVKGAWLKFCGQYDGQRMNVAGRWQRWCAKEAQIERTERHRAATAPQPGAIRSKFTGLDYKGQPEGPHTPDNFNPNPISRAHPLPDIKYVATKEQVAGFLAQIDASLGSGVTRELMGRPAHEQPRKPQRESMTEEQFVAERERQLAALAAMNGDAKHE